MGEPEQLINREQYWMEELRAWERGYNLNPRAGSNLGRVFDAAVRARVADGARRAMNDPAVKERHREATKSAVRATEVRERSAEAARRRWADPEYRAKQAVTRTSDAYRSAQAGSTIRSLSRPEVRLAREEGQRKMRATSTTPEGKAKRSLASKGARQREWGGLDAEERRAKAAEMAERSSRRYNATSASGTTAEIKNLKRFCREQGIPYGSAINVLTRRVKTARGWTFERLGGG